MKNHSIFYEMYLGSVYYLVFFPNTFYSFSSREIHYFDSKKVVL